MASCDGFADSSLAAGSSELGSVGDELPSIVLDGFELEGDSSGAVPPVGSRGTAVSSDPLLGSLLCDGNWMVSEPSREFCTDFRPQLPRVGDELMGLRLIRELGRGAFARVFLAEQRELADRPVAVKISIAQRDEAKTLAQLQHTHIVPIYSAHSDPHSGMRVLIMPYFGGTTLDRLLSRASGHDGKQATGRSLVTALDDLSLSNPATRATGSLGGPNSHEGAASQAAPSASMTASLPTIPSLGSRLLGRTFLASNSTNTASSTRIGQPARTYLERASYLKAVTWIAARLAEGLAHAHQRGILHRDIKPSNILIASDGQPMLLDFNLARDLKSQDLGATAYVGGTLPYMAPEHLDAFDKENPTPSTAVDERSDIYALGVVLYEMLTKRRAFAIQKGQRFSSALLQRMAQERRQQVPSPRAVDASIPRSLDAIVRRCLAPDPARRYQQAAQLAEDLQRELDNLPLRHTPEPSFLERLGKWTRRHPRLSSGGSIAALGLVLIASLIYLTLIVGGRLVAYDAERRWIKFQQGLIRAQLLVHASGETGIDLAASRKVCEETLDLFDISRDPNWMHGARIARLDAQMRQQVADNATELAILLARIRVELADHAGSSREASSLIQDAVQLLEQAEQFSAQVPRALYEDRSSYRRRLGDVTGADADLDRAQATPLQTARDYYLEGTRLSVERRFTDALRPLQTAIRLDPRHFWAHFQLAICYYQLGKFTRATDTYNVCEAIWQDCAWTNLNRGLAFSRQERWREAIADYTAAIRKDAQFAEAYLNRGLAQLQRHSYADAVADLSTAIKLGQNNGPARAARAAALAALAEWDAAQADFATALALSPGDESILLSRGFTLARHNSQGSLADFDAILRRNPSSAQAHYGRAFVLSQSPGFLQEAIDAATSAIDCDSELVQGHCTLAVLEARDHRFTQAIERIEAVLRRWKTGMTLYSAASVYALASSSEPAHADRALELISQAFQSNYGQEAAATDSDLEPIRQDPRFQALLGN